MKCPQDLIVKLFILHKAIEMIQRDAFRGGLEETQLLGRLWVIHLERVRGNTGGKFVFWNPRDACPPKRNSKLTE
jgi:hypothetical protein